MENVYKIFEKIRVGIKMIGLDERNIKMILYLHKYQ